MAKSIIQTNKECLISTATCNLQQHHIFNGVAYRKKSEKYGLKVWLLDGWHQNTKYSVHKDKVFRLALKKLGQIFFEEHYGHDKFIKEFNKDYLAIPFNPINCPVDRLEQSLGARFLLLKYPKIGEIK